MPQVLILLLVLILGKLLVDYIKKQANQTNETNKGGDIIDISEAWIDTDDMPYSKKEAVLDKREMDLYRLLAELLNSSGYQVYPGISLSALLTVPTATANRQEYLRRIKERALDLVIMESPDLNPVLVINLESAGESKKQQLTNRFTEKALASAGLTRINISLNSLPNRAELVKMLRRAGLQI